MIRLFKKKSSSQLDIRHSPQAEMVEKQVISRGIKDKRVIEAMLKTRREKFVPEKSLSEAYADYPLPIGEGQTISQPYMVALMTELLCLKGKEKVLEIGTGSGYQTALLAELCKSVYTVERIASLSKRAQDVLSQLGYKNIYYKIGDGTLGWEEFSPYDDIIVTAASFDIPEPLLTQLAENGKIVIPIGDKYNQTLTVVEKKNNKTIKKEICGCVFVPLIGKYGWST